MATGKLIGSSVDPTLTTGFGQYFWLVKYTAEATGLLSEIKIKSPGSYNVKVAVYADNAGEPGALLAKKNTSTAVVAGWNTIALENSCLVIQGTDYWEAVITENAILYYHASSTARRWKSATYSGFTFPDPAGTGFTSDAGAAAGELGFGVLVVSPSGLSQPIAYGTPKLSRSIKPPGYQQAIAYGTPTVTVETAGITIYPPGLQVVIAYGAPALRYPQTISPPGLNVPIAYGTLTLTFSGAAVIYVPGHQQSLAYGTPTILKYVFHLILDGRYNIESPETNRAYVIGRDVYGNPVYGEAHDSGESDLVGERLDFQPDPAVPTEAQAGDVAAAVLAKMRLTKARGVILIPYNCGQELWDVVQITDAGANQPAVKFRVVGLRFEYSPRQARYQHKLILGAP